MKPISFKPLFGLVSKHLQMIVSAFTPSGKAPASKQLLIDIGEGDQLSCEVSTPFHWKNEDKTIVLIHGLGGSHSSRYIIRAARKFYKIGYQVVRVNLRGCGSGIGLSKKPYCAGNSQDLLKVVQQLKKENPKSPLVLIGFSLGGNIVLKLGGELGECAKHYLEKIIAICPPLDLDKTCALIQQKKYILYHRYYLKSLLEQAKPWVKQKISTLYEYDHKVTAPFWGFKGAKEYYQASSSIGFLNSIRCETDILFAKDDPFIKIDELENIQLPSNVHVWTTEHGSHLGFIGITDEPLDFQWLDQLLLKWVQPNLL